MLTALRIDYSKLAISISRGKLHAHPARSDARSTLHLGHTDGKALVHNRIAPCTKHHPPPPTTHFVPAHTATL